MRLMKRNPLKLTSVLVLGLGAVSAGHWMVTGSFVPEREAHAHAITADMLAMGSFDEVFMLYQTLRSQGTPVGEIADAVAGWMDLNEWRGLSVGELAELWNMLNSDLVASMTECSARWTGSITAPLTDTYTFSNLYHSTTDMQMRVWVNGQLVLQPASAELLARSGSSFSVIPEMNDSNARGDQSTGISLQAGQTVQVTVEMNNFTPHLRRNWGYPVAILFWEGQTLPRAQVPGEVLSPPEGFGRAGSSGLKAELYDGPSFNRLVQTRLDDTIDVACMSSPFAPVHLAKKRAVMEILWPKFLAADFEGLVEDDFNEPARILHRLGSGLPGPRKATVLELMNANPEAVQALDDRWILAVHSAAKHVQMPNPGSNKNDPFVEFVATWCEGQEGDAEFGVIEGYENRQGYARKNHYPYYILGRWLKKEFWPRLDDLLQNHLMNENRSCQPGVASVLAFGYRESARMDEWIGLLDQMLDDETLVGDARASWLVARGYAEEIRGDKQHPLAGVEWLNQALAEADSDVLRLNIVRQLVVRLGSMDEGERAEAIIMAVGRQVAGAEEIASWRTEIVRLSGVYEAKRIANRREAHLAHVAELQRRLTRAMSENDQSKVERYQRLLQEANSE
ncbi:MAG: PA14 domain-containing protein [Planctomycetota bacterium]|nr:PA14 domain-containing protein [Planctomycetota bacterium]